MGAGAVSSLISCPAELLMIQQQRTGQPLSAVARRIVGGAGLSGLYRGLVSCFPLLEDTRLDEHAL